MAEPARHLHIVDAQTGDVLDSCPGCSKLEDQVKGAEKDIRAWRARYADLARDKEAEARKSQYWRPAIEVWDYWRERCSHPKAVWNADRFFLVEPFLKADGAEMCKRAIDGAAFDPFVTTRRNGSKKRHDGWELIFRDRGKFEEFACRAPRAVAA